MAQVRHAAFPRQPAGLDRLAQPGQPVARGGKDFDPIRGSTDDQKHHRIAQDPGHFGHQRRCHRRFIRREGEGIQRAEQGIGLGPGAGFAQAGGFGGLHRIAQQFSFGQQGPVHARQFLAAFGQHGFRSHPGGAMIVVITDPGGGLTCRHRCPALASTVQEIIRLPWRLAPSGKAPCSPKVNRPRNGTAPKARRNSPTTSPMRSRTPSMQPAQ